MLTLFLIIELYTQVELTEDLPEYGLKKGDTAMVIEHYKMPEGQEDGYSLEGFDLNIDSITVEVKESQIKPISINITLDPDMAKIFTTSEEVNKALRAFVATISKK